MRRKSEATRQKIIDAAYEQIWRAGFNRTSLDTIAARADVTKRTLYSYFRSKDDLLAAVLAHYNDLAAQRLTRIGDRMPADRDGMVDSFFGQLAGWASATPRWSGSGFTRLVVELADLPGHPARALARRAKTATEIWLADRLAHARVGKPRERACEIMLLLEGSMALTLIHGQRRYIDAASRAAKRLLAQPQPRQTRPLKKEKTGPRGERSG
jgi:AcrR family transcriptional regulator